MSYHISHRAGDDEDEAPLDSLSALYDELEHEDEEHPDVSLTHDSEWTLAAFGGGLLIWENAGAIEDEARHMKGVPKEKVLELWRKLAQGKIEEINEEPWLPGCGPPMSDEERVLLQRQNEEFVLAQDKLFYESLGAERSEVPCREDGCKRGAISLSVLCRVHHFESIWHKRSPFSY